MSVSAGEALRNAVCKVTAKAVKDAFLLQDIDCPSHMFVPFLIATLSNNYWMAFALAYVYESVTTLWSLADVSLGKVFVATGEVDALVQDPAGALSGLLWAWVLYPLTKDIVTKETPLKRFFIWVLISYSINLPFPSGNYRSPAQFWPCIVPLVLWISYYYVCEHNKWYTRRMLWIFLYVYIAIFASATIAHYLKDQGKPYGSTFLWINALTLIATCIIRKVMLTKAQAASNQDYGIELQHISSIYT